MSNNKLYIEANNEDNDQTFSPSSVAKAKNQELSDELLENLKDQINKFLTSLNKGLIDGYSIKDVELSVSFSAKVNAWIIQSGGEGAIKLTLKPNN